MFETNLNISLGALACILAILLLNRPSKIPKGTHLPPGPPRKPLIGNVLDIPQKHEWETYTRWAKEYGDLVYINVLRKPMVFVNSLDAAQELYERRSSIYSDRFEFPMLVDLMGFGWHFVTMRYGDRWRRNRKAFHQHFYPGAIAAYRPVQIRQCRELLQRFRDTPEDFFMHLRLLSGALIMEVVYGIKVRSFEDPFLKIAEEAFKAGSIAANPGTFLVDTLTILKYVPEWMPGAGFKTQARLWRNIITKMPVLPFEECKRALNSGGAPPSYAASMLERLSNRTEDDIDVEEEEELIRGSGASTYGAGADTTTVALQWFMLAMVLYPEVQKKAQAELDAIVGDRLPIFEDQENLPYMEALCKEIQRWHAVFPLGIAHGLMQDDVYKDMFLPKGTVIIGNAWAMLHDEKIYGPNVDDFDPDRFLRPGVKDPTAAFGFGRRICPGRYFAENTIFITAASILKVFEIGYAKDEKGNNFPLKRGFTSGTISRPDPFECSITLRSAAALNLVDQALNEF